MKEDYYATARQPDGPVRLPRERVLEIPAADSGGSRLIVRALHTDDATQFMPSHLPLYHRHTARGEHRAPPPVPADSAVGIERTRQRGLYHWFL